MVQQPPLPPEIKVPRPGGIQSDAAAAYGTASLVLAFAAPVVLYVMMIAHTVYMSIPSFFTTPTYVPRSFPLIVAIPPTLVGILSVALAIASLKGTPPGWKTRWPAAAALCINAAVFSFNMAAVLSR